MNNKKMNLAQIFLSFLKVGVIGFGGGSALIPVVERELVEDRQAMEADDYIKHTVIANITPGALPVKLGATCGYQLGGCAGALAGAYAVMLPGVLLTVAILSLFSVMGTSAIQYFNDASVGITAFIVFLLASYVIKTVKGDGFRVNLLLCLGAFVLTGGGELRQLLSLLTGLDSKVWGASLFDISTIDLMIVTFFMILLLDKLRGRAELMGALMLCGIYSFCVGKAGRLCGADAFSPIMLGVLCVVLGLAMLLRRKPAKGGNRLTVAKSALLVMAIFILIPLLVTGGVVFSGLLPDGQGALSFVGNVGISTVTSFGGGEAYVSVADGIFVQSGCVAPDLFYTRLVPVANALPGPILIKVASGIGYLYGIANGSSGAGWAMAAAAATVSVGACAGIAVLVMQLYDSIGHSVFIVNLKRYILPVICGMLVSTSLSMLGESMKITAEKGMAGFLALPLLVGMILFIHFLHKRYHLHDIILLMGSAVLTLVGLMLL